MNGAEQEVINCGLQNQKVELQNVMGGMLFKINLFGERSYGELPRTKFQASCY